MPILSVGVPWAACGEPALITRAAMATTAPRADLLMAIVRRADLRGRLIAVMSFPRLHDGIAWRHEHLDPAGGLRLPHELPRHLLAESMHPDGDVQDGTVRQAVMFFVVLRRVGNGRGVRLLDHEQDRKSTRLNSSHITISYAVFCLKK